MPTQPLHCQSIPSDVLIGLLELEIGGNSKFEVAD